MMVRRLPAFQIEDYMNIECLPLFNLQGFVLVSSETTRYTLIFDGDPMSGTIVIARTIQIGFTE